MKVNFNLTKATSLIAILMFSVTMSCKKNEGDPTQEPKHLETNLVESADMFNAAMKKRNSDNTFTIEEVIRKDASLQVKVKGGVSEESFRFIWDGSVMLSYPMRINLVLKHDNEKGDFDKNKDFLLTVNLQKILGDEYNMEEINFSVINGSMKQRTNLDPNGSVSNESN